MCGGREFQILKVCSHLEDNITVLFCSIIWFSHLFKILYWWMNHYEKLRLFIKYPWNRVSLTILQTRGVGGGNIAPHVKIALRTVFAILFHTTHQIYIHSSLKIWIWWPAKLEYSTGRFSANFNIFLRNLQRATTNSNKKIIL